jgi:hypothetical protein
MHRAGGLVVGRGDGPAEVLDAYAAAVAAGDGDLAEFLRLELFPADEHEPSGIVFDDIERDWRVEIGPVTADHLPDASLRALHDRLAGVLAGS